ncbi:murein hydrolase activator EnvC [Tropicimonas sp. IMCC34011]|uniref:murein hydrolase activator EnvC family protein n=1 Tax=Tropicimonas sp. IMCC34011 TaxID=2248759 RepID=UPI000E222533|nr:peptidoglycan DD-metalloendopeptidase family protein [Tropicimonas sp. IMCC34011]
MAVPATAQEGPAAAARAASALLEEASAGLEAATGRRERVAALTGTVRAYEEGLAALRDGIRDAAARERVIEANLAGREEELSRLLGALSSIGNSPPPVLMMHPDGPLGAARSGMMLADVAPGLRAQADALRADLAELRLLRALQDGATEDLARGMSEAQAARLALSQAVAERTDLPLRTASNADQMARLAADAGSLAEFAALIEPLPDLPEGETGPRPGALPLPVNGQIIRRYDEIGADGIARPGWSIATRPAALVTTPLGATVRYAGPLAGYGNVIVLEPARENLMVLAGLDVVYGAPGQVLPAGAPVGVMGGGSGPDDEAILTGPGTSAGATRSETLYLEVREGDAPADPATWFAATEKG